MSRPSSMHTALFSGMVETDDIFIPSAEEAVRAFDALPDHTLFPDNRLFLYPTVRIRFEANTISIPGREAIRVLADGECDHYVPLVHRLQDAQNAVDDRFARLLAEKRTYISHAVFDYVRDELEQDTEYLRKRLQIRGIGKTPFRVTLMRGAYESWERLRNALGYPLKQGRVISPPPELADRAALVRMIDERGNYQRSTNAEGVTDAFLFAYSMDGPHTICSAQTDLPVYLRKLAHGLRRRGVRGIDPEILPATQLDTATIQHTNEGKLRVEYGSSFWKLYRGE